MAVPWSTGGTVALLMVPDAAALLGDALAVAAVLTKAAVAGATCGNRYGCCTGRRIGPPCGTHSGTPCGPCIGQRTGRRYGPPRGRRYGPLCGSRYGPPCDRRNGPRSGRGHGSHNRCRSAARHHHLHGPRQIRNSDRPSAILIPAAGAP